MDGNKKAKIKSSLLWRIAMAVSLTAVVAFGAAFVFFAVEYYHYWRDGQTAQENAEIMQVVFSVDDLDDLVSAWLVASDDETPPLLSFAPVDANGQQGSGEQQNREDSGPPPVQQARAVSNNPDIIGFIRIAGTRVGDSIVQGRDNDHYLYHDVFNRRNAAGALFMDYRNRPDFSDRNTIIYGHNMNNGTMFHDLRHFRQFSYFDSRRHITVIADEHILIYEIFAVFTTHIDFDYIRVNFSNDAEFQALINEMLRISHFNTGVRPTYDDRILVLSTCLGGSAGQDYRIVVAGRLITPFPVPEPEPDIECGTEYDIEYNTDECEEEYVEQDDEYEAGEDDGTQ